MRDFLCNLKSKICFLTFILLIPSVVNASNVDGVIDPVFHYAWSENSGWIDFGSTAGNVHVTDTAITGSVYGENIGWIIFNPPTYGGVINNGEGVLSGYAWGENVGWVDFSKVTIDSSGVFSGAAYSENIGWVTFGTGDNKVLTDWRPASTRSTTQTTTTTTVSGGGGGSSGSSYVSSAPVVTQTTNTTPTTQTVPTTEQVLTDTPKTTLVTTETPQQKLEVAVPPPIEISNNLTLSSYGEEVKSLQVFLNNNGFYVSTTGVGAPGNETNFFGNATRNALIKFQIANGIYPSDGFLGPITRNFIKNLKTVESLKIENSLINNPSNTADKKTVETSKQENKPVTTVDKKVTETQTLDTKPLNTVDKKTIEAPKQENKPVNTTESKLQQSQPLPSQVFTRDLNVGMAGKDVATLQEFLIKQNIGPAAQALKNAGPSGFFGVATKNALAEFQKANNAPQNNGSLEKVSKTLIENSIKSSNQNSESKKTTSQAVVTKKESTSIKSFGSNIKNFIKVFGTKPQ